MPPASVVEERAPARKGLMSVLQEQRIQRVQVRYMQGSLCILCAE